MSNPRITAQVTNPARRVLVHLPNWLGDVIMTTPLIDFLAQAFAALPANERPTLHLAVRRPWSVLFADDPRIDDMLIIDREQRHAGVGGIWRQAGDMKQGHYDAIVLCPPSLRAGLAAALAGISLRVGHATDGRGLLLKPGLARGPRGSRHYSFEMLELGLAVLESLQIPAPTLPETGWPLPSLPGCADAPALTSGHEPVWVVAPGTTYGEAKTWPRERMSEFVALAHQKAGARVVLVGDQQVAAFVAEMRQASDLQWTGELDEAGDVVDLTGRTDLLQVVQIMKSAAAFIGNDSGLMHLAGALGLPTVGIFGSSNPDWTHPLGARTSAVVAEGFACRPCYRKTCNQARFCLAEVAAGTVLEQVQSLAAQSHAEGEGA